MKVNHHQIKNAVAHVSKKLQVEGYQHGELHLVEANNRGDKWELVFTHLFPEGTPIPISYIQPRQYLKFDEIDSDESVSLDNLCFETYGIAKAIDSAWGLVNHADKIAEASLHCLYLRFNQQWGFTYFGLDNIWEKIEIFLSINGDGTICEIKLK